MIEAVLGGTSLNREKGSALSTRYPWCRERMWYLYSVPLPMCGDKAFPDAGTVAWMQEVTVLVPAVEVPDHRNPFRVRRPDREIRPLDAVDHGRMCAELVVEVEVRAFVEKVQIVIGQERKWRCGCSG
ncbi:MAG: hypothetical protein KatS3mg082_0135 [Nitrospiraceae bacterium]|nr:MAG: hypothetical protein KatS3mg082_0135 [Nitrospiraceae bacterium]